MTTKKKVIQLSMPIHFYKKLNLHNARGISLETIAIPQFYRNRSAYIFFIKNIYIKIYIKNAYKKTSNNQRLPGAGDNDRRSKRFCSIAVLCAGKFHVTESQTVIRLTADRRFTHA